MEESTHENSGGGDVEAEQIPAAAGGGETVVHKKGAWSKDEDEKLKRAVDEHGLRNWVAIEKYSGLARPAKNCRLRWLNYLRPNLKKYPFTDEEEQKIIHLHAKYGNSWSRIAAKLPGRSDNDIKNFWHKRAKKCQKHHLPIYPPTIHDCQDNTPTESSDINATDNQCSYKSNTDDVYCPNFENNPDQTLPYASTSTSIYSTQTPISTPNPQFQSSSCSLTTSQPTNNFTKTNLLPETPTSRTPQSLLLSPHQTSKSTEIPFTPQIEDSWQERKPPILSSPEGRFGRFTGARAQSSSALLNTDSLAMESPKSPLKLKLSPGVPPVYSITASSPTTDSNLNNNSHTSGLSSSEFQLKSPSTASLSPLHLRLSIPVPSDFSFQSNLPILDSTVELNSSTSAISLPSPRMNTELPPIPPKKADPDHDSSSDAKTELPSIQFHTREVQSDGNSEILDELKAAEERVRILKKKLRQRKVSNKRTLPKERSRRESFSSETSDLTGSGNSSISTGKEQLINTSSRTNNMLKRTGRKDNMIEVSKTGQFKRVKSESEIDLQDFENLETRTLLDYSLQREHNPGDIVMRRHSMTFQEQINSLNLFDHNSQNNMNDPNSDSWCSSLESLFCESSTLGQDTFLIADLFDQKSGVEGSLASQGQEPLIDAFGPIYSQSPATTLVKSGYGHQLTYPQSDEGGFYSNSFGQEFSHGPERKFAENELMDQYLTPDLLDSRYVMRQPSPGGEQFTFQTSGEGNLAEASKPCDPSLLLQQHPGQNLLDSRYLVGSTTFDHEIQPYSLQIPSEGFFGGSTEKTSSQTWKQEPTQDQSLTESLLVENLWPEEQMVAQEQKLPTNRNGSVVNPSPITHSMESNKWNGESSYDHAGEVRKQELVHHDYKNTMSDDLSNLLEFFPTSLQTFECYNNGDVFPGTEDFDEFDMHLGLDMSAASMLPITIADYM